MSQPLDWACVFDRLSTTAFEQLRSLLGDGVSKEDFCEILLDVCSADDADVAIEPLRSEILGVAEQLFLRIDINGNGDVSWDEFSHYVVHAVQSGNEVSAGTILQHVVYPASHESKLDCPRLKKTVMRHISTWDKYCFLEVQARQRSVLSLYKSSGERIRLYAQSTTEQIVEDVTFCDCVNMLCLTTVSEKLQFYSLLEDPVLAESGQLQILSLSRDHYLQGRHPVLRYDPETALLFAGGSDGTVSVLDPSNDFAVLPPLLQKVRMHGTQPIIDLVVLPERGRKMLLTSGLDGKIQTYDIVREEFFGELGAQVGAHSMSFANEFSMLVTCSNASLDPLVWAPHAASNPFVCRLVDDRFGSGRGRLVECYCPPQTTYAFTADSTGLIKLWDMRQLKIVRTLMADARQPEDETDADCQLFLRCFTASSKLSVFSCCRSKTGSSLYFAKADNVPERNPVVAHDDHVVSIGFAASVDNLLTASKDCVKLWDLSTGTVAHHLVDFWQGSKSTTVTSCAADGSGKRFYLGTESAGLDGSVFVSNVAGDHPEFLYAVRLDQERRTCCFDACGELKLAVVGDSNGVFTFYDCWPPANGSVSAVSRPARDSNAQSDACVDSTELSPLVLDSTCVTFAGRQPFAAFGDVQGRLGIVATRPHPLSGTRLCAWRSFYPRASQTIVAVPLSLAYDEESEMLVVGDDQGNVTVWSCSNVVNAYHLSAVSWPMSIAERLALPTPAEQPLALSPRFVANFRAAASEASNPVRFVRVAYDTIFAVVENAVSLLDCTGRPLGSMMQGRGMGLEGTSAPYTFRKERSDDDDEPKGQSDVMPRTLTTVPTLSRLKRSMSVFRPCKAAAGFTVMRDSEYNELCLSAPEYDEQFLAADFDDAALVTPPPSARDATKQVCRFSRPMSPMTIDASSEKNLPYFLQLKSSTADSSARMPGVRCTIDCPEVEDETVAERVLDKLEDLDEEGARYIYLRPPLNRLKAPTTVEIFSGAPSCELNWKLAVQQRPLVNRVVSRDVLSFRPTQIVAPSAMLECLALKSLTRSSHSLEPAVSMSASPGARLGSGRFVRFQKKEGPPTSAPVKRAEPTLDHFVLPASPLLVPRSAAQKLRDKVIQSLSLTPETELASQPGRPLTPLKDICNSESAMMARAATSASRPKPLSFVFGFGQSLTTASRSSTPSWQAARKTVVQRSASALPQACQRAELSLGQPPGQPRVRGQASGYAKRQEYLQLLLHLPRMRKPVANAERLDLVRRL